jgi:hypothetical protein
LVIDIFISISQEHRWGVFYAKYRKYKTANVHCFRRSLILSKGAIESLLCTLMHCGKDFLIFSIIGTMDRVERKGSSDLKILKTASSERCDDFFNKSFFHSAQEEVTGINYMCSVFSKSM